MDPKIENIREEVAASNSDLEQARLSLAHAHDVLVAACNDPKRGADLPRLRKARAGARCALVDASRCAAEARDRLLAAEARHRLETERDAARAAEEARQAEHVARVASVVAVVNKALAAVEEHDRATFAGGGIASIVRGEVFAEILLIPAIDALADVEPHHALIATARARAASMVEPVVLADLETISKLAAVTDHTGDADVARAQAAVRERAHSKLTGRWFGGDPARNRVLLSLIGKGAAFLAEQVQGREITRQQGLWVRTAPGLAQCHRLPDGVRPRSEATSQNFDGPFSPPRSARDQIALFFGVLGDVEAMSEIPDIRSHASQAAA